MPLILKYIILMYNSHLPQDGFSTILDFCDDEVFDLMQY